MDGRKIIAYILYYIGFGGFVALTLVLHVSRNKIAPYIFARDLDVHGRIIPCPLSWLTHLPPLLLLTLVALGLGIGQQNYTIPIFLVIIAIFLGILMLHDACTHLILEDDRICITIFRKQTQYLRSDIRTIEWKCCRGITGRLLVIGFRDGKSYFFNMDHYQGVQNTYNELSWEENAK